LKHGSHEFALMRSFALRFRGILRGRELDKLDIGSTKPLTPGSPPSRVSRGPYAVTLTPFAMPLNFSGATARRKGRSTA
jgi:hypothetical protein